MLKPFAEQQLKGEDFVLFQDNLNSQKSQEYCGAVKAIGGANTYGPPNRTEGWQPLDTGHIVATVKILAKERFESWMERKVETVESSTELNWEKWERNGFSPKEKRIMCSWVFGDAWDEFCGSKYWAQRRAAFEKGGCLIASTPV